MPRTRHTAAFALITVVALTLTACGSGDPASAPAGGAGPAAAGKGTIPTTDVVSAVKKDEAAAKLLPADVRASGSLSLASSVGTPPGPSTWRTARPWPAPTSTSRTRWPGRSEWS